MSLTGPVRAAIIAAFIVGVATYFAETSRPELAGILATIPVALPTIWLLSDDVPLKDYMWSFTLGISAYLLAAVLYYYLVAFHSVSRKRGLVIAMGIWLILVLLVYFALAEKAPHK